MTLRDATVADAAAIAEIYNREVLSSLHTFDLVERSIEEQRDYIRARSGGLAVLVAEDPHRGEILGFASLSFYRDRPGYRTSVEDSVYVHQDHYRRGLGSVLLAGIIERAQANGFHAMFARIANAQEASIGLHRQQGFTLVGVEREVGRKFGRWLDVALMQRLLQD